MLNTLHSKHCIFKADVKRDNLDFLMKITRWLANNKVLCSLCLTLLGLIKKFSTISTIYVLEVI